MADLCRTGWVYRLGEPHRSQFVAADEIIPAREVAGILVRVSAVRGDELTAIVPSERHYVAAECMAFLVAMLHEVRCPVLNRPSPAGIGGPVWRQEQWSHLAASIGLPVASVHRRGDGSYQQPSVVARDQCWITVVGDRSFCERRDRGAPPEFHAQARQLAKAAAVNLLTVGFSSVGARGRFVGAEYPHQRGGTIRATIVQAMLEYLVGRIER
jgi:hypothetical protein